MGVYGRQASIDPASGSLSTTLRSSVYQPMTENGWGHTYGIHAGDGASGAPNPVLRGQVHALSAGAPAALAANTGEVIVSTFMGSGTTPSEVTAPLTTVLKMPNGVAFAIGAAAINATLVHGMIAAGSLPAAYNKNFYSRTISTTGPFNPHGYTAASINGWMTNWIVYETNRQPNAPTLSPAGTVNGQPSAFTGTFTDPDQNVGGIANPLEGLTQFKIQLRVAAVGGAAAGPLLWDTTLTATTGAGSERTNNLFSRAYAGSGSLDPGIIYEWRALVMDDYGEQSAWSNWTAFDIASSGSVSIGAASVVGRQTTTQPNNFNIVYGHAGGLSGNLVQVDFLLAGAVSRSQQIAVAWAPGAQTATVVYGTSFPTLPWGTSYKWRVRVRDTNNEWSTWSPLVTFNTNYRPSTPANLAPTGGAVSSGYPLLTFTMTDQDNTVATGLTAEVRIKNSTGTVLQTRTATLFKGKWEYQTVAADIPSSGTYRFDARGRDGTLDGFYSPESDFYYAQQPVVTAPTPNLAITSMTLNSAWTVTGQVRRRILIYLQGTDTLIYNGGWFTSTIGSASISGVLVFTNGGDYDFVVEVELAGPVVTRSARVPFEVLLDASHSVAPVLASSGVVAVGSDLEPTAIVMMKGTTTGITSSNFRSWNLKEGPSDWLDRWNSLLAALPADTSDALRAKIALASELKTVVQSASFATTSMTWYEPLFGEQKSYALTAVIQTGINQVESLPTTVLLATISTYATVIHDVANPTGRRIWVSFVEDADTEDEGDVELYQTWSDGPPEAVDSGLEYERASETYIMIDDESGTAIEKYRALQALKRPRDDRSMTIVCRRNDIGERLYGKVMKLSKARRRLRGLDASISITEVRR